MKKTMKKFIAIALSMAAASGCFVGCGNKQEADTSKSQLYIGNYDAGSGREWIRTLADEFEKAYADYSFEEGKKGVQVWITHKKEEYKASTLMTTMKNYREQIYILDSINYGDWVSQDLLMDVTDVMTEPNALDGNKVLADKTTESRLEYFNYGGKYYALPFMDHTIGIVYDVDLFEEKGLFISGSLGVDGKEGTLDDGLPTTEKEFWDLLEVMKQKNITPFTWCGRDGGYRTDLLNQVWAKYEGADNFALNSTFDGEYTFAGDTEPTTITLENGYLLTQQTGKLKALEFAKKLLSDTANYSPAGFYTSQMHTDAQEEYLVSCRNSSGQRIAMLVEGSWFENEATLVFSDMEETFGAKYAQGTRRFGFMPLPNFEGGSTDLVQYMGAGSSCVIAPKDAKNPELVKTFLKFMHTDENLAAYTAETGITRPYTYQLSQEQYDGLSYFGKSVWSIMSDANLKKVYKEVASAYRATSETFFSNWGFTAQIGSSVHYDPFLAFFNDKSLTAETYLNGTAAMFTKSKWDKELSKYYQK